MRETSRQIFHAGLGIALIIFLLYFGRIYTVYILSGALFFGFLLINLSTRGIKIPLISHLLTFFERKNARLPGYGSAWYVVGLLICCLLIPNTAQIAAAINKAKTQKTGKLGLSKKNRKSTRLNSSHT